MLQILLSGVFRKSLSGYDRPLSMVSFIFGHFLCVLNNFSNVSDVLNSNPGSMIDPFSLLIALCSLYLLV